MIDWSKSPTAEGDAPTRDADLAAHGAEDEADLDAFLNGDENAFNALVLRHQGRVYGLCHRFFCGDRDEAADAAQETFVKAYHGLREFRRESRLSTWLYRIAINVCKNRAASAHFRHGSRSLDISATAQAAPQDDPDRSRAIESAIAALPEEQRVLVILRDIEGRSYEEVSETTGLNLGTVKSRLNRARGVLRERLRGLG